MRLDKIHPVVSGNKWLKLQHFLAEARARQQHSIVTFGGAYSNHIVATAFAAQAAGMDATGIIRGEEPRKWSPTLQDAASYGMQLRFVSRALYDRYKRLDDLAEKRAVFADAYMVPEGGMGQLGVKGVSEYLNTLRLNNYSHYACAIGTGTTITGLAEAALPRQKILGFSSMKNNNALAGEIESLFGRSLPAGFEIIHDYHFGGYGKHTTALINWMNEFFSATGVELDFVYTAKMMFGLTDRIKKGLIPAGSKILALHTGGLQGNRSIREQLIFS